MKILLLLIIPSIAFADPVFYLEQGVAAPSAGYLVSPKTAEAVRNIKIDLNAALTDNAFLTQEIDVLHKQVNEDVNHIDTLKHRTFLHDILPFTLGVLTTGAVYGIIHSIR